MLMLKKEGKIALIIVPGLYGQYPFHCQLLCTSHNQQPSICWCYFPATRVIQVFALKGR